MMKTKSRTQLALNELYFLEDILRVDEARDFIEVIGTIGGDVYRYRVYFDANNNITGVYEK